MDDRHWIGFVIILFVAFPILHGTEYSDCTQSAPLGVSTGEVHHSQLTASSVYPAAWDPKCQIDFARLYQPDGYAWCAKAKDRSQWLQVDLGVPAKLTGVMVQGRADGREWVTAYKLSHSLDATYWEYVRDIYEDQRVFEGGSDSYEVKHSYLDRPIEVRFVRFHPVRWHGHPSIRVELVGCQACRQLLGLPPYSKISASSFRRVRRRMTCQPEDGFLISNKGWCPRKENLDQWLELDVGPPTLIVGVVSKGRGDPNRKNWVTSFRVSFGNMSANDMRFKNQWTWYRGQPSDNVQVFSGNFDQNTDHYHYFEKPFRARYIRVHPNTWRKRIAMRFAVIGCPFKGSCTHGFMKINDDTPCVANLAFHRKAWLNTRGHSKRHLSSRRLNKAMRATDGKEGGTSVKSCTVLDNYRSRDPIWTVDLGSKQDINGAVITTWPWQNQKAPINRLEDYLFNLDKISIYFASNSNVKDLLRRADKKHCATIGRLNEAIYKPRLHFECAKTMHGRYLFVRAVGIPRRKNRLFNAILCEVMVYA